jgi:hypothetical protein
MVWGWPWQHHAWRADLNRVPLASNAERFPLSFTRRKTRADETNLWHAAFTAVQILTYFFCPTVVYIPYRTCVYTHTRTDCIWITVKHFYTDRSGAKCWQDIYRRGAGLAVTGPIRDSTMPTKYRGPKCPKVNQISTLFPVQRQVRCFWNNNCTVSTGRSCSLRRQLVPSDKQP